MTHTDNGRLTVTDGEDERLAQAWQWLCEQRAQAPDDADVWDIRWQAMNTGPGWLMALLQTLRAGKYRLSPVQLHGWGEERKAVWGAQDALVLKWVALSLQDRLPLHPACEHVKGHGGGKPSIAKLHALLTQAEAQTDLRDTPPQKKTDRADYVWVCRTDIRGYYRHISKQTLLAQVKRHVTCPVLTDLVNQYLHDTVEDGGTFHTPAQGISRGCSLSPLLGALHLYDMDAHFSAQPDIRYARYMDDVIILAKRRWQLRKHTKRLMQWFSEYGFEAHPDKTFIGRTQKGFDGMGAWLTDEGVMDIAPRAKANHREKVRRLYERLARVPLWARKREGQAVQARVSRYRKRWHIWVRGIVAVAGISGLSADPANAVNLPMPTTTAFMEAPIGYSSAPINLTGGTTSASSFTDTSQRLQYQLYAGFQTGGNVPLLAGLNGYPLLQPGQFSTVAAYNCGLAWNIASVTGTVRNPYLTNKWLINNVIKSGSPHMTPSGVETTVTTLAGSDPSYNAAATTELILSVSWTKLAETTASGRCNNGVAMATSNVGPYLGRARPIAEPTVIPTWTPDGTDRTLTSPGLTINQLMALGNAITLTVPGGYVPIEPVVCSLNTDSPTVNIGALKTAPANSNGSVVAGTARFVLTYSCTGVSTASVLSLTTTWNTPSTSAGGGRRGDGSVAGTTLGMQAGNSPPPTVGTSCDQPFPEEVTAAGGLDTILDPTTPGSLPVAVFVCTGTSTTPGDGSATATISWTVS